MNSFFFRNSLRQFLDSVKSYPIVIGGEWKLKDYKFEMGERHCSVLLVNEDDGNEVILRFSRPSDVNRYIKVKTPKRLIENGFKVNKNVIKIYDDDIGEKEEE